MSYCIQCRVELEPYVDACPLCAAPVRPERGATATKKARFPDRPAPAAENTRRRMIRFLVWEVVSIILASALAIVLLTNLIVDLAVTWAWYPMAAMVLAWLLASFPLLLPGRPLVVSALTAGSILLFMAFIDFIDNLAVDWFLRMALPISALVILVTTGVILLSVKMKKKGFNIAAFILFGTGLLTAGLDAIITFQLERTIRLSWSVFVIIPVLFTGFFCLYIHYRLGRATNLKKWFQL